MKKSVADRIFLKMEALKAMRQRHDEIYLELRRKILDGARAPGSALPTFSQLGEEYGVSVATINKTIAKLKRDGLVKAVRGSGVFVAERKNAKKEPLSIGVILPELASGIYLELIGGISSAAEKAGFNVQLCDSNYDAEKELALIESLLQNRRVKGLLLSPCGGADCKKRYEWLREIGLPFVFVDRYVDGMKVPLVACDSVSGARKGVEKLLSMGHSRIAFLSAEASFSHQWCKDRLKGYKEALSEAKIKYDKSLVADKVSAANVKALLGREKPPTALFLASNRYLHCVLEGVELGRGGEIAIAGFDEVDASIGSLTRDEIRRFMNAPLVKIIQPFREIGEKAAKILAENIRDRKDGSGEKTLLSPKLVCAPNHANARI